MKGSSKLHGSSENENRWICLIFFLEGGTSVNFARIGRFFLYNNNPLMKVFFSGFGSHGGGFSEFFFSVGFLLKNFPRKVRIQAPSIDVPHGDPLGG